MCDNVVMYVKDFIHYQINNDKFGDLDTSSIILSMSIYCEVQ